MKTISIIICTQNRAGRLKETLEALHRILPGDSAHIEIVVVDNGSTDSTAKVISNFAAIFSNVRYVFEPVAGKSIALNHGARKATGDIMAWLDDDVIPLPGWLENITQPLIEGKYDVVTGRVFIAPHLLRDWMTTGHRLWMSEALDSKRTDGVCSMLGGNMAASREILEKTHGFDPELGPGRLGCQEESLLADQMVSLGACTGFIKGADIEHHFDAARLKRQSWLKSGEERGRSSAYVSYHWYHSTLTFAWLRRLKKRGELMIWRLRHRPNLDPESEGISMDEIGYVQQIAFLDQYRIESHKPRLYEKLGSRKRV